MGTNSSAGNGSGCLNSKLRLQRTPQDTVFTTEKVRRVGSEHRTIKGDPHLLPRGTLESLILGYALQVSRASVTELNGDKSSVIVLRTRRNHSSIRRVCKYQWAKLSPISATDVTISGVATEILKALQNRSKLNPIVKTDKNC